jgi:two-component system, OmpR family, response regulator
MDERRTVLIVNGDPVTRTSLSMLLAQWQYSAIQAKDGTEALRLLKHSRPDLTLLSWELPDMTGLALIDAIRSDPALAANRLVILSRPFRDAEDTRILGGIRCLRTPVAVDALRIVLDELKCKPAIEVLLVDDNAAVGKAIAFGLRFHGFAVRLCNSGRECVRIFKDHRQTIDVVLLDVQMSDMDGPDTLSALRIIDDSVTAIFITGNTGDYTSDNLLQRGAVRVFQKPILPSVLARELLASIDVQNG